MPGGLHFVVAALGCGRGRRGWNCGIVPAAVALFIHRPGFPMTAPVLQALLVADQIYQDQATGKFVICGIFGTIFFLPHDNEGAPVSESAGDA